jgi:hypothetical protein
MTPAVVAHWEGQFRGPSAACAEPETGVWNRIVLITKLTCPEVERLRRRDCIANFFATQKSSHGD